MKNSKIYQWFKATIALLLLIMPAILTDELTLLENWLFTLFCWLIVIAFGSPFFSSTQSCNEKPQE